MLSTWYGLWFNTCVVTFVVCVGLRQAYQVQHIVETYKLTSGFLLNESYFRPHPAESKICTMNYE